jgi:hypothetical protein
VLAIIATSSASANHKLIRGTQLQQLLASNVRILTQPNRTGTGSAENRKAIPQCMVLMVKLTDSAHMSIEITRQHDMPKTARLTGQKAMQRTETICHSSLISVPVLGVDVDRPQ